MKQAERVLKYMRDFGSITQLEAMQDLGCMRLGARVYDLKREGYNTSGATWKQVRTGMARIRAMPDTGWWNDGR